MWSVKVDQERCNGCGACVESCPGEVYVLVDGRASVVQADDCHGCHTCEAVCEQEACRVSDS